MIALFLTFMKTANLFFSNTFNVFS